MAYINTKTFDEIFLDCATFIDEWKTSKAYEAYKAPIVELIEGYTPSVYYFLSARYGSSHIADKDEEKFKLKLFTIMFQYMPVWVKELDIQNKLLTLTEEEILKGSVTKHTHGFNPSDVPGTANSDTEIETVNDQSLSRYTKSKMEAYAIQLELLQDNKTEKFLNRFKKLFMTVVDIDDILEEYANV